MNKTTQEFFKSLPDSIQYEMYKQYIGNVAERFDISDDELNIIYQNLKSNWDMLMLSDMRDNIEFGDDEPYEIIYFVPADEAESFLNVWFSRELSCLLEYKEEGDGDSYLCGNVKPEHQIVASKLNALDQAGQIYLLQKLHALNEDKK